MTKLRIFSIGLLLSISAVARSQITPSVDLLGPGDPGYDSLPAGVAVVDCFVDVAATDMWQISGMRVETHNTTTLLYARDGNDDIILINPGTSQQYTTFVSRPRGRDAVERFTNGAATIAAGYPSPVPDTSTTLFSVSWLRSAPSPPSTPDDGYVARIAIDLGDFADRRDFLQVSLTRPDPAFTILASATPGGTAFGWAYASFDVPSINGTNWYLFDPLSDPATPGDLDGDGDVDLADLAQLLAHFATLSGATYADGDVDGDGDVDIADLAILLGNFGT